MLISVVDSPSEFVGKISKILWNDIIDSGRSRIEEKEQDPMNHRAREMLDVAVQEKNIYQAAEISFIST